MRGDLHTERLTMPTTATEQPEQLHSTTVDWICLSCTSASTSWSDFFKSICNSDECQALIFAFPFNQTCERLQGSAKGNVVLFLWNWYFQAFRRFRWMATKLVDVSEYLICSVSFLFISNWQQDVSFRKDRSENATSGKAYKLLRVGSRAARSAKLAVSSSF